MKQTMLKDLVYNALDRQNQSVGLLARSDNPQVISIRDKAKGKVVALQAVLNALNNDGGVDLKILAE